MQFFSRARYMGVPTSTCSLGFAVSIYSWDRCCSFSPLCRSGAAWRNASFIGQVSHSTIERFSVLLRRFCYFLAWKRGPGSPPRPARVLPRTPNLCGCWATAGTRVPGRTAADRLALLKRKTDGCGLLSVYSSFYRGAWLAGLREDGPGRHGAAHGNVESCGVARGQNPRRTIAVRCRSQV